MYIKENLIILDLSFPVFPKQKPSTGLVYFRLLQSEAKIYVF